MGMGGFIVYSSSSNPQKYINLHGKVQDFGINMNMHANERHWRFFRWREGGGVAMVKERGIVFFISSMPWKDAKKINKFVNLHGKS
jgi:hypothetical protein